MPMRIIFKDVEPGDFVLASRAAQYLLAHFQKDVILAYGDSGPTKNFYVRRNKSSITVRPCAAFKTAQR